MDSDKPGMNPQVFRLWRIARRRKYYLLIPVVVLTVSAGLYSMRLPERFRARVLVAAEPSGPEPYLEPRPEASTATVQEQLRTIRETLLGPGVLGPVIREFGLYGVIGEREADRAMEAMKSRIQIQVDAPDAFFVGFEGDQPRQVTDVANRLATVFVERVSDIRGERVARIDSFLDTEVDRLRRQLNGQEDALKGYKQSVVQELPDRVATNLKALEDLHLEEQSKNDKITEGQSRRMAVVEEMQALEGQGALEPAAVEKTSTDANLEALRLRLRQLKTMYTPEYPEIKRTEKEIRDLEAIGPAHPGTRREPSATHMRYIALQAELKAIDQRLESYRQERAALTAQASAYESRINASPGLETTLSQRLRDIALTRSQYESMLAKQQAGKLSRRVETTGRRVAFRIVEPAQVPTSPYSPKRLPILLMAFVVSLGLGFAAVLLVEQLDTTFDTAEEFQRFTNLQVMSVVPNISTRDNGVNSWKGGTLQPELSAGQRHQFQKHRIAVAGAPHSIPAQQFSILALRIHRWMERTGARTLAITSAAGGEGKSLTALNLSMALASSVEGGVLLIDCDLSRPQVHERLAIEGSKGLSDLLSVSDRSIDPYLTKIGNLFVIPGGTLLRDPGCLHDSRRMTEILARAKEQYRFIVLDSPPIVPIADSHFLAGIADGVLLIVRARKTRRELLQRAIESLGSSNILGVVLNDAEYGDTRYAYAYRYYQRHYLGRR